MISVNYESKHTYYVLITLFTSLSFISNIHIHPKNSLFFCTYNWNSVFRNLILKNIIWTLIWSQNVFSTLIFLITPDFHFYMEQYHALTTYLQPSSILVLLTCPSLRRLTAILLNLLNWFVDEQAWGHSSPTHLL